MARHDRGRRATMGVACPGAQREGSAIRFGREFVHWHMQWEACHGCLCHRRR